MSEIRKRVTIEKWIRDVLADTDKDGPCTGLGLIYKKPEGGTKELDAIKLSGKTWEAKNLAERIQGKAETFAQDLTGIQNFSVLAFYKERKEAEAELPFVVVDGEVSSGGIGRKVKETPDSQGLTAQLMRHLERREEMMVQIVQSFAATSLQREIKMYEREEKSRDEVNDAYAIVRDLIMKAKQDDHQMAMELLEKQQSLRQKEQIFKTLPAVINTVADKEIIPQATADTALIEMIAESVKPEQIETLEKMGVIKPEAASILKLRLLKVREDRAKEAEEAKKLPPAGGETLQ